MSLCVECHQPEHEHHAFRAVKRPSGCVCEAREWGDPENIPPVCKAFRGLTTQNCAECEHDIECHAEAQSPQADGAP